MRDSEDPGAVNVLTSGSKLPTPITVNELFEESRDAACGCEAHNRPRACGGGNINHDERYVINFYLVGDTNARF